jgi:hypothetical protein
MLSDACTIVHAIVDIDKFAPSVCAVFATTTCQQIRLPVATDAVFEVSSKIPVVFAVRETCGFPDTPSSVNLTVLE